MASLAFSDTLLESKNGWAQIHSALGLTYGLLDAGAYEEALGLTQHAIALARTLPPTVIFHRLLAALGNIYQALQQGEEAYSALEEAEAVAKTLHLGPFRIPTLTRLCMNAAEAGQWEAAYTYALKAIALRKSYDAPLIVWDFYRQYETEALLRGGMSARPEQKRNDSGNSWDLTCASAFLKRSQTTIKLASAFSAFL